MIYLAHPSGAIAACETPGPVPLYQASGYQVVTYAAFRAAWALRDARTLATMRDALPMRAVGDAPPAGPDVTMTRLSLLRVWVKD